MNKSIKHALCHYKQYDIAHIVWNGRLWLRKYRSDENPAIKQQ